jgi:hypothetical protein
MDRLHQYLLPFCLPLGICGMMLLILPSRALREAGHSPLWVKGAGMLMALVGSAITLLTKPRQADHDEEMEGVDPGASGPLWDRELDR